MPTPMLSAARLRHRQLCADAEGYLNRAQSAGRGLTDAEIRAVDEMTTEAEHLAGQIERMAADEARAVSVGQHAVGYSGADLRNPMDPAGNGDPSGPDDVLRGARPLGAPGAPATPYGPARGHHVDPLGGAAPWPAFGQASAIPPLDLSRAAVAEMVEHVRSQGQGRRWSVRDQAEQQRAAVGTSSTGYASQASPGPEVRQPRRIAVAGGLPVENVTGYIALEWPTFGAGSADVVAELAAKPEYANVGTASARPVTIAVWTDVANQVLLSVPSFDSRLRQKHAALITKRENTLALASVVAGNPDTITAADGQSDADALLQAVAVITDAAEVAPSLAIVNPNDVVKILGGQTTGSGGEAPSSSLRLGLHGLTLFPTTSQTQGTALVGAFGAGLRMIVGQPYSVLVDPYTGMKNNKTTILAEEGVGFVLDDVTCFRKVAFDA